MNKTIDNLNQRGNSFSLVLNDNELNLLKNKYHVFNTLCCSEKDYILLCVMYHDKDYVKEENRLKTPHYHVVITFGGQYRVGTIINWLSDLFHINANQISCEKCNSVPMQVRYLVHMDDFDKYQYECADILTNNKEVVSRYLTLQKIFDLTDCVNVVRHYHYDLEMIMTSVINYDNYRKYINDLISNYYRRKF